MTIVCSLYPLGTTMGRFKPDEVLCDLSNGETAEITLYPGVYYIEAQGAGGSGGQYGTFGWGRGTGGGSAAGFKGLIRIKKTITTTISTAVETIRSGGSTTEGKTGNPTTLTNMFTFNGGQAGWGGDEGFSSYQLRNGGLITVIENDDFDIIQADYLGNGNPTDFEVSRRKGGDSVITNDGGGLNTNATSPGAGGCGYSGSGVNGGNGGEGTCLIKYVGAYGPNDVIFAQPNLTADTNGTQGGDSFAVWAESEVTTQPAWQTFNGITVTDINNWVNLEQHMPTWIAWYNPKPLKISKLRLMNCINAAYNIKDFQIQVSDFTRPFINSDWTTVQTGQNTLTTAFSFFEIEIPVDVPASNNWRLYITSGTSTSNRNRISIQDIKIYATVHETPYTNYYCYQINDSNQVIYLTTTEIIVNQPLSVFCYVDVNYYDKVSSADGFNRQLSYTPTTIVENGFIANSNTYTRMPENDFYDKVVKLHDY